MVRNPSKKKADQNSARLIKFAPIENDSPKAFFEVGPTAGCALAEVLGEARQDGLAKADAGSGEVAYSHR